VTPPSSSQPASCLDVHALTIDMVRQRLAGYRAGGRDSGFRSDDDLNPGMPFPMPEAALKPAAVLIPIIDRPEGPSVLLTQRVATLRAHAGQIAFPGGQLDGPHETPQAAALREAQEEVGLEPHQVEVIATLDCYRTRTGYIITPVVGIVQPGFTLSLHAREVAEAFEVPLSFLVDPARRVRDSRVYLGAPRFFYAIPYGERYIWGATAGMIVNLADALSGCGQGDAGRTGAEQTEQGVTL